MIKASKPELRDIVHGMIDKVFEAHQEGKSIEDPGLISAAKGFLDGELLEKLSSRFPIELYEGSFITKGVPFDVDTANFTISFPKKVAGTYDSQSDLLRLHFESGKSLLVKKQLLFLPLELEVKSIVFRRESFTVDLGRDAYNLRVALS